nr:hypothetical protein [Tanacetum cinerariifolium]
MCLTSLWMSRIPLMTSLRLDRCPVMLLDELMVDPVINEIDELIVKVGEQTVAPVVDMKGDITVLFGDDDDSAIKDLCTHMGNLEYGHGQLVKKVIQVSDAEVAYDIAIGEIGPRVSAIEGRLADSVATDLGCRDEEPRGYFDAVHSWDG